jgi:uncharacterized membrane protein
MLSSGVVITWHQCCHKHQHKKTEHVHCHETKIFIKIEDVFTKSKTDHLSFQLEATTRFLSAQMVEVFEKITPHFQYFAPPLLHLVGVNFLIFTSQRIFYS